VADLDLVIKGVPDPADLWDGQYKIPWHDPDFSRRMLAEHLDQSHDQASRRSGMIDQQVGWIHDHLCGQRPCRVLDLGCGPGLYLQRLADLGHQGCGIDFSPASCDYARRHVPQAFQIIRGDLRATDFGSGYDLAMMLYGEMNVFSPGECAAILDKIFEALRPGGRVAIEPQTFTTVKKIGQAPSSWSRHASGLFSDRPYLCLIENDWFEDQHVARQCFYIIEARTAETRLYRNTTKAWTETECQTLLTDAGFHDVRRHQDWPTSDDALFLMSAER
jgi:SAM-dependent methyltransferase